MKKIVLASFIVLAAALGGTVALAASGCCPGPCCGANADCCK